MSDDPKELQEWLRRLKYALAAIPAPERDDICNETRAHLRERIDGGKSPAAALDGFGTPEDYARQFVDEMEIAQALGSQKTATMLSVIGRRLHRSLVAALAGIVLLPLGAAALMAASLLYFKLTDPAHTGLWRGPHLYFIGTIDDPATATDLLGGWLYPLTLGAIVIAWLVGRVVLLRALKMLAHKS